MCGRYFYSPSDLRRELPGLFMTSEEALLAPEPRDVRPGDEAEVILDIDGHLVLTRMRWGFENANGGLVINARSETVDQRPMFKPLSAGQRCAIPASGYYEWRRSDRQKYSVALGESKPLFMAGLYRNGARGMEFVILTQPPVSVISPIHNRMPLLLDSTDALREWLGGGMSQFQRPEALKVSADGPEQLRMSFF